MNALLSTQHKETEIIGTGRIVPVTSPDHVMVSGSLVCGAVASIHVKADMAVPMGVRLEVNGAEGDLLVVSRTPQGQDPVGLQRAELVLSQAKRGTRDYTEIAVPLAGVTESQTESLLALKFSVPEPVLVTLTKAGDGSDDCRMECGADLVGWRPRGPSCQIGPTAVAVTTPTLSIVSREWSGSTRGLDKCRSLLSRRGPTRSSFRNPGAGWFRAVHLLRALVRTPFT